MAAQPKRKITRINQGKRRHGNTPKLVKDANSSVPTYKREYFAKLMKLITGKESVPHKTKKALKATTAATAGVSPMAETSKPNLAKAASTVKKVTRTQHKGA